MATTTNFGWQTPDDTDLVKDGAAAIRTLGSAIDTSLVDLKGGTTGQVLAKASNTDLDFSWVTDATGIPATIFDAKGDLIAATAADTAGRLAVGANGTYLAADSSTATGLKWATPTGKIIQVVSGTTTTETATTSTSYVDTTLTATITPTSSTSTILVMVSQNGLQRNDGTAGNSINMRLVRGSTQIALMYSYALWTNTSLLLRGNTISIGYVDSPATTSATTYKTQFNTNSSGQSVRCQMDSAMSTITLFEIGA